MSEVQKDDSYENMRNFYLRDRPVTKMRGEMMDICRYAAKLGHEMGFSLTFSRKTVYGIPVAVNEFTGRVIVRGGGKKMSEQWMKSFLIKEVKEFLFSPELYQAYVTGRNNEI